MHGIYIKIAVDKRSIYNHHHAVGIVGRMVFAYKMPGASEAAQSSRRNSVITIAGTIVANKAVIGFGAERRGGGTKSDIDNRVAETAGT